MQFSSTLLIALIAIAETKKYNYKQQCDSFCMRKDQSDLTEEEWSNLNNALATFKSQPAYKDLLNTISKYDTEKDIQKHLPRLRVWLAEFEKGLNSIDSTVCLPYYDWTRYYSAPQSSTACNEKYPRQPVAKPYKAASPEVIMTLQDQCKKSVTPYDDFSKQYSVYASIASTLIGSTSAEIPAEDFVNVMKWAQADYKWSDFQTHLTVFTEGDNSRQYSGSLDENLGYGKVVSDILDVRDLCYGYILPGNKYEKPAAPSWTVSSASAETTTAPTSSIASSALSISSASQSSASLTSSSQSAEGTTPALSSEAPPVESSSTTAAAAVIEKRQQAAESGSVTESSATTVVASTSAQVSTSAETTAAAVTTTTTKYSSPTSIPQTYGFDTSTYAKYVPPTCPSTYYPSGYVKPTTPNANCPVKDLLPYYKSTTPEELTKYDEQNYDYSVLPEGISGAVTACQKRENEVYAAIAANTYNLEPVEVTYDENRPYTGAAKALQAAESESGAGTHHAKSVGALCIGFLITALFF
ncbi:hypothetical protein HK099_008537 [Clydaea vesicula]|uniref:Uncharacterized protein n=1 Tax=Clydaea vesicula TaxID=447962 RepID=A0AAD5U4S5_9FUNG|nr:hypothetical protein HK099_008537 [Clydaea vesicula]